MQYLMAAALLPVMILMWYIRKMDKIEKEPLGLVLSIVGLGALTVFSAMLLEEVGENILKLFLPETSTLYIALFYFIVVAGAEELGKMVVLRWRTWKSPEFNYTYDAIVYAVAASLGFAALENVFYTFMLGGMSTAIARAFTSIPGHAMFGVFMGCHYGLAKLADVRGDKNGSKKEMRKAFWVPLILHGFYDFTLSANGWYWLIIFFIFYLIAIVRAFLTVRKLSAEDRPVM